MTQIEVLKNLFASSTTKPFICVTGPRNGYIMLASTAPAVGWDALSPRIFTIAQEWAAELESLGSERTYWITLSETIKQLHIHLYPRWKSDTVKGVALFEQRNNDGQPVWEPKIMTALQNWAQRNDVEIVNS